MDGLRYKLGLNIIPLSQLNIHEITKCTRLIHGLLVSSTINSLPQHNFPLLVYYYTLYKDHSLLLGVRLGLLIRLFEYCNYSLTKYSVPRLPQLL